MYLTALQAYRTMRDYFSRDEAVLAKNEGSCFYRDNYGNKCAVGCLIPDKLFNRPAVPTSDFFPEEGNTLADTLNSSGSLGGVYASGVFDVVPELREIVNGTDDPQWQEDAELKHKLLSRAQRLHDTYSDNAREFVLQLTGLAVGLGIEVVGADA